MAHQESPILIIGAGVSGLALANGLHKHNIPFILFERDTIDAKRPQGYRLRIAAEGLDALEYLLDDATWSNFELTCADMRLGPIHGIDAIKGAASDSVKTNAPPPKRDGERLPTTVDRTLLREVMFRGLPKESVRYGKTCQRYEETANGVRAFFEDGTTFEGRLIVASDGANSHVRRQYLPSHEIVDTAGRCIYGKTLLTDDIIAKLPAEIMGGMSAVKDSSQKQMLAMVVEAVTFPQRKAMEDAGFYCPPDYLYWVIATKPGRIGYELHDDFSHFPSEKAEALALKVTENWHPATRVIVEQQVHGQTATLPIRSVKPNFGTWEPNPKVTLIGDAVHLMGPTAGSGAITALRDSYHLCKTLVEQGLSKESIGDYEATMREYASRTVETSWLGGKYIFGMRHWDEEEWQLEEADPKDQKSIGEAMEEVRQRRGR